MPRDANDLLHGTLDLLVLKAVAGEPMHGFGISKWIEQRTKNELEIVDSALYKALHRLEDSGAISAEWGVTENNRRAKYYSLTSRGRQCSALKSRHGNTTSPPCAASSSPHDAPCVLEIAARRPPPPSPSANARAAHARRRR